MARAAHVQLDQPVFHEPSSARTVPCPTPPAFHGASERQRFVQADWRPGQKGRRRRSEIRAGNDELFTLAQAYGNHGQQIVEKIQAFQQHQLHALGDSEAS